MEVNFKKIYAKYMFISLHKAHPLAISPRWCMNEKLHVVLQYLDDYWKEARRHLHLYRVLDDFSTVCSFHKLPYEQFMIGLALEKAENQWLSDIRMLVFDMFQPQPEQCDSS